MVNNADLLNTKRLDVPEELYEDVVVFLAEKYEKEDNPIRAIEFATASLPLIPESKKIKDKIEEIKSYIRHLENREEYKNIYEKASRLMLWFREKNINKNQRFVWLLQKLKATKTKNILDVGCYRGGFSRELAGNGYDVTGVDISERNIKIAQKATKGENPKYKQGFAEDIAKMFPNNKFDAILLFEILEHVKDPREVVDEAKKILVPGGKIYITLPISYSEYGYHQILKKDLVVRYIAWLTTSFREHVRKFDDNLVSHYFGAEKDFSKDVIRDKNDSWFGISFS